LSKSRAGRSSSGENTKGSSSLKVDGVAFGVVLTPPLVKRLIEFLGKLPDDEVFTSRILVEKMGLTQNNLKQYTTHPELVDYRERLQRGTAWGNPKAIAKLRELLKVGQ